MRLHEETRRSAPTPYLHCEAGTKRLNPHFEFILAASRKVTLKHPRVEKQRGLKVACAKVRFRANSTPYQVSLSGVTISHPMHRSKRQTVPCAGHTIECRQVANFCHIISWQLRRLTGLEQIPSLELPPLSSLCPHPHLPTFQHTTPPLVVLS